MFATIRRYALGLLVASLHLPGSSQATVLEKGDSGFTVSHQIEAPVTPQELSRIVVEEIHNWWLDDHTWSGSSKNLKITSSLPACFCERMPNRGFVQHMQVVSMMPGKMLRMTGGLGPLQEFPVNAVMTFRFEETRQGSRLVLTYKVRGDAEDGVEKWAGPVDSVLGQQLESLSRYIRSKQND